MDYTELAAGVDQMRETLRSMVAGVMSEGFTEVQARDIVTGIMSANNTKKDDQL